MFLCVVSFVFQPEATPAVSDGDGLRWREEEINGSSNFRGLASPTEECDNPVD